MSGVVYYRSVATVGLLCYFTCLVYGQVATLCRPNERFLSCGGCQKTCQNPSPVCAAICREGCYCPEDYVRNETGHCIPLSECPSSSYNYYQMDTSEPRSSRECPQNEEYRFCEPCNRTCENPYPICRAQCNRGCFCVDDLVRNADGKCVPVQECRKPEISNYVANPNEYHKSCGPNQEFKECSNCEKTCSNPNPICPAQCTRGCFCKEEFVKALNGDCIKLEECPKVHSPAEMSLIGAHELTVEDCASDEEYLSCGWCEPTCSEPFPQCPIGVCTRGCLCRPPLLRHYSGQCVEPKNCLPQKCPDPNEEYVCKYGCEARCDQRTCPNRPRGCSLGCHCRLGLLRDINTGLCVNPDKCSNIKY